MLVEISIENDRKLFAAFMDLEKAYDRVDKVGHLVKGIQSFFKDANASVQVKGEERVQVLVWV